MIVLPTKVEFHFPSTGVVFKLHRAEKEFFRESEDSAIISYDKLSIGSIQLIDNEWILNDPEDPLLTEIKNILMDM